MERRIFGIENEYGVTCTLRGQRRLSPDEVARYLFRRVVSWGRSSNVFLGNGARLERINWLGDLSDRGLTQSAGMMVNYLYDPGDIEKNHEGYAEQGIVAASPAVSRLAPAKPARPEPEPA